MWLVIMLVLVVGAIGGFINAVLGDDRGILIPKTVSVGEIKVFRPGVLGNIGVGAFAAFISWALYGPLSNVDLLRTGQQLDLTLGTLGGAGLIGFGGARWLTNEVAKTVLKEAVSLAQIPPTPPPSPGGAGGSAAVPMVGTVSGKKIPLTLIMSRQEVQNATPMKLLLHTFEQSGRAIKL